MLDHLEPESEAPGPDWLVGYQATRRPQRLQGVSGLDWLAMTLLISRAINPPVLVPM